MKVLALDVATKTGFAVFDKDEDLEQGVLVEHGLLKMPQTIKEMVEAYPWNYIHATQQMAKQLTDLVARVQPDVIVIEETNLGKQRYTQKLLEFLHNALLTSLEKYPETYGMMTPKVYYLSSRVWRSVLGLQMTKDDKKNNKALRVAKERAEMFGVTVDKKAIGVKGKVGWKHLSVRFVNDKFDLKFKQKDNDVADAICLAIAFAAGAEPSTGND